MKGSGFRVQGSGVTLAGAACDPLPPARQAELLAQSAKRHEGAGHCHECGTRTHGTDPRPESFGQPLCRLCLMDHEEAKGVAAVRFGTADILLTVSWPTTGTYEEALAWYLEAKEWVTRNALYADAGVCGTIHHPFHPESPIGERAVPMHLTEDPRWSCSIDILCEDAATAKRISSLALPEGATLHPTQPDETKNTDPDRI